MFDFIKNLWDSAKNTAKNIVDGFREGVENGRRENGEGGVSNIRPKKLAIMFGAFVSAAVGSALASSFVGLLGFNFMTALLVTPPALVFGAGLGFAAYLQGLKDFQQWPMQQQDAEISFRPSKLWDDVIFALKAFDWKILRFISARRFDQTQEKFKNELFYHDIPANTKAAAKLAARKYAAGISEAIHTTHFETLNKDELKAMESVKRSSALLNEADNYAAGNFITANFLERRKGHRKGFFETIAATLYDEYQNPPKLKQ